ncbi:NADH dehydrogenase (quinone) subunit G [candidate division GN15 bacterium]|uniref:NADH dehydrogenase (Quinone) subunit G n=1 Tax=candidate division GN15 bacterium TaxID=2072418 RepID=A0A855X3P1_9BACT|nr:MAG: NADH dehydrogenase (quinone) subunit G [candidate division GN15 bacterium]
MSTSTTTQPAVKMVTLTINDQSVTVPKGTTVLQAALGAGIHIPTFCWHPKLKSVGACRICYVEIEKMPKLQVSCATEATDGMVVKTESDIVKRGRKAVLEFILANHPLDCPTCDKGGECDLQNLTFAHGLDDSRFDFLKRRHIVPGVPSTFDDLRIGPEIMLNRNRCILCYKCVRSNKEAFGEYDIGAFERGNAMEINAAPGEQVANPFSGNLVEICPVGALTNSDWRYKIRVWLTQTTPSIDIFNSSGSNILFYKEDHKNRIFRTISRRNDEIDDGWITDVARYGYQLVHSPDRLQKPLMKKGSKQVPVEWEEAVAFVARRLAEIDDTKGCVCIGGLASPTLDLDSLHSFSKFMRKVIGTNNLDFRIDYRSLPEKPDSAFSTLSSQPFTIAEIDTSDVIFVFGSDLVKEHPNEYLRIRKARNFGRPLVYSVNSFNVKSADVADREFIYAPGTEEVFINGLCLAAIEENPGLSGADGLKRKISPADLNSAAKTCGVSAEDLKALARTLINGKKISFIVGDQVSLSRDREVIAAALCNLNRLVGITSRGQMAALARYADSIGAEKLGLIPNPHPDVKRALTDLWGGFPEMAGYHTEGMFSQMLKGELDAMVILGANPVAMYPDHEAVAETFEKLDFLVVADLFETETTAMADVVLPLASWTEFAGRYVNLEGRIQKAERAIKPLYESKPAYAILADIAAAARKPLFSSAREREEEIEKVLACTTVRPWPGDYLDVRPPAIDKDPAYPIMLIIGDDPHHRCYVTEKAASLVKFCSDAYIELSPELAEKFKVEDGDAVRVESKYGKLMAPVKVSRVLEGDVVFLPRNFSVTRANSLVSRKARIDWVRINKVSG